MRARRPELFSDSTGYDEAVYPRSVFDHYLNTLTSRNEERLFEVFARRLAEREICPNLVSQTGPVGGGDSKVDSETYPVSDAVAATWYHADAHLAAREKWAFAISAKREWRSKVQSDVRKIAATGRGYTNITFITSQYVPDKARGELQDALSLECSAKVTIHDRSWILQKTYGNRHLDLAFEVFSIVPTSQRLVRQGPADATREADLVELDRRIADVASYAGSSYRRAEDALEAALLSRSLGRSGSEVDGRFVRAIEMAAANGGPHLLRFKYLQAWTRFWWFDDAEGAARLYEGVFAEGKDSENAWSLQRSVNLWFCLLSATKDGVLSAADAQLDRRAAELVSALEKIQGREAGSTNSLFARTQLVYVRLAARLPSGQIDDLMKELREVVLLAGNHIDFPMDSLSQMLQELDAILGGSAGLDDILELVFTATESRASNESAADILIERAERKLRANKPYDAISLLGRALVRLKTTEARRELLLAMALLAAAYERVGLLWAARGMLLLALERGLRPLREDGEFPAICASLMRRICWLEVQLGRPTRVFRAVETANLYQSILGKVTEINEAVLQEEMVLNLVFGILLLRTPTSELAQLQMLPGILSHQAMDLPITRAASLFALGYTDAAAFEAGIKMDELSGFFERWVDQPAADDLPELPTWHLGTKVTYRTCIVGCEILFEIALDDRSVLFVESLIPAIEAYAANAMTARLFPVKSVLRCRASPTGITERLFSFESVEDDCGETTIEIAFNPELISTRDALVASFDTYLELVITIVHNCLVARSDMSLEAFMGEGGETVTRATIFQGLPIVDGTIFGDETRLRPGDWAQKLEVKENFSMLRSVAWDKGRASPPRATPILGNGDSAILSGQDGLKHSQMVVGDIINVAIWNRAGWNGTLVQVEEDGSFVIGLLFQNIDAGKKIFRGLRRRMGPSDSGDLLQLAIITGISSAAPRDYRVVLSPNASLLVGSTRGKAAFLPTRSNTMNTQNTVVVDLVTAAHLSGRAFRIAPAVMDSNGQPQVFLDLTIQKSTMSLLPAWTIDDASTWMMGLKPADDVVIPDGVVDAPVIAALARLASFEARNG